MKQYGIVIVSIALAALIGFVFPPRLLRWQDQKRLETIEIAEAEEVFLQSEGTLSIVEKMLFPGRRNVTFLPMEQGKHYNRSTIQIKAMEEIEKLRELEILEPKKEGEKEYCSVNDVLFLVETSDGTNSMMLWNLGVIGEQTYMEFTLDDETGKILQIYQQDISYSDQMIQEKQKMQAEQAPEQEEMEQIARRWGDYLGITLVSDAVEASGYREWNQEISEEIENLEEEGLSKEEASEKVYESWGIDTSERGSYYAVFKDEKAQIGCSFLKNLGEIRFSVSY